MLVIFRPIRSKITVVILTGMDPALIEGGCWNFYQCYNSVLLLEGSGGMPPPRFFWDFWPFEIISGVVYTVLE